MVEVTITVPQGLHEFLEAFTHLTDIDVNGYCVDAIVRAVDGDISYLCEGNKLLNDEVIRAKYGLGEVDPDES